MKWAVAPEKKRDGVIEMPSMVHVGEEGLRAIYSHVMKVSEGVAAKAVKNGDPFAESDVHNARPQVQRMFMPDAGPAAIAIALDGDTSACWDAGESRFRYAWSGGFIDGFPYWKGNGSSLAKIKGTITYIEQSSPLASLGARKFQGYRMESGLPVFLYKAGDAEISEKVSTAGDGGFSRKFTISPTPTATITLDFRSPQKVGYSSDKGKWSEHLLELSPQEASEFTVTISPK